MYSEMFARAVIAERDRERDRAAHATGLGCTRARVSPESSPLRRIMRGFAALLAKVTSRDREPNRTVPTYR